MRSSSSIRGIRRLLMAAGVLSLGVSAAFPTVAGAQHKDGHVQGGGPKVLAPGLGAGEGVDRSNDVGQEPTTTPADQSGESKTWVCHQNQGRNDWELVYVAGPSLKAHAGHGDDRYPSDAAVADAAGKAGIDDPADASLNRRHDEALAEVEEEVCGPASNDNPLEDEGEGEDDLEGEENLEGEEELEGEENLEGEEELDAAERLDGGEGLGGQGGSGGSGGSGADGVGGRGPRGGTEAPPSSPPGLEGRQALPVIISNDSVARPVTPAPAAAPKVKGDTEVLGSVTTRTPGGQVLASQTLPRTGSDLTVALAAAGITLLLAGVALEAASRRKLSAA